MVNILRAGRHFVKVVFSVASSRRCEILQIFLWKCILGQTVIIYQKFDEGWSIFGKVIARRNFTPKRQISWPRPSDAVNLNLTILITFHGRGLKNTHAKFQTDRMKAVGGVRSNTTPENDPKNTKTPTLKQSARRTLRRSPGHQETFLCNLGCYILPLNLVHVDETVSRGSSDN